MVLVMVAILTELFLTFPAELVGKGQTATWMILVVSTIAGGFFFLPTALLMEIYPGKSIIEIGEELVGAVLNIFFSLAYLIFFLVTTALILRQYAERTITASIPELPISVAMGGMLMGAVVACYLGLEAIARSAWFIIYFIGFTILLVSLLTFPYWNLDYLFPLGGAGIKNILIEGLLRSSVMGEVLLLAVIFPALKEPDIKSTGLAAIVIGGMTMVLTMLGLQVTFGVSVLQELSLPTFEMSRLIYFGRFVQRLESVFVPIWALVGLSKVAIGCYIGGIIFTRMFKLPYYYPFMLPTAVIIYSLAFIPANVSETVWLDLQVVRNYGWSVAFFLPAVLLVVALFKGNAKNDRIGE